MLTIVCCLVVGLRLGLGLGLDLMSGWLVAMHTYLYYFRLSFRLLHFRNTVCDVTVLQALALLVFSMLLLLHISVLCLFLFVLSMMN